MRMCFHTLSSGSGIRLMDLAAVLWRARRPAGAGRLARVLLAVDSTVFRPVEQAVGWAAARLERRESRR